MIVRDAAAFLAMLGLCEPLAWLGHRCEPRLPTSLWRLMSSAFVGVFAYVLFCWGMPPVAMQGPIESMPASPLGAWAAWAGFAGLLLRVQARWHQRGPRFLLPVATARASVARRSGYAVLLLLPATWLMPWAIDETSYHLALPLRARVVGHVAAPLGHGNGGFFALVDWLGSWGLSMGSLSAARGAQLLVVHLAMAASLDVWPQKRARLIVAWALFFASPLVVWQLCTAYVDVAQAAYTALGVLVLARTLRQALPPTAGLLVGGGLLGAAAASKASAWLAIATLAWALLRHARHLPARARWQSLLAAGALPLPFVVHNLWRYHAPLFPFDAPWWPGGEALLPAQFDVLTQFFAHHGPTDANGHPLPTWAQWAVLPWALVFQSAFASPRFDGVVGGLPLLLAGYALWRLVLRQGRIDEAATERQWLGRFAGVFALQWLLTAWQARFLLTPLLLSAMWLCLSPTPPLCSSGRWPKAAWAVLLQVAFWPSLKGHMPWPPSALVWRQADRVAQRRASVPASVLCEAPTASPGPTMLVWTQRLALWCPQASVADSYDEAARLEALLLANKDPHACLDALRALPVAHLLVDESLWFDAPDSLPMAERARLALIKTRWAALRGLLSNAHSFARVTRWDVPALGRGASSMHKERER